MSIPVLVEPTAAGYRAKAGGPFDLSADGPTAAAALAALRQLLAARVNGGAACVEVPIPQPGQPQVMPLAANPLLDDWLKAVEEYRDEVDAADAARGR